MPGVHDMRSPRAVSPLNPPGPSPRRSISWVVVVATMLVLAAVTGSMRYWMLHGDEELAAAEARVLEIVAASGGTLAGYPDRDVLEEARALCWLGHYALSDDTWRHLLLRAVEEADYCRVLGDP